MKTISFDSWHEADMSKHGYSGKSNPIFTKFAKRTTNQHFLCKCLIANVSRVQSQRWKHQNNMWNLFKVSNKTIECCTAVFIINLEQVSRFDFLFPLLFLDNKIPAE